MSASVTPPAGAPLVSPWALPSANDTIHAVHVIGLVLAAATTFVLWEYLLFLPSEFRLLRKRKFTTPVILLFVVRYSTLAASGSAMAFVFGNPPSCRGAAYTIGVMFWIMNTGVQGIFYLRTCAICEWQRSVRIGLLIAVLMTSGCWFASIWSYKGSDKVANLAYGGKCFYAQHLAQFRVISYLSSMIFDTVILAITIWKLLVARSSPSIIRHSQDHRTSNFVLLQTLAYFLPVFCANASGTVITLVAKNGVTRILPINYTFSVSSIAAARMVFSMHEFLSRKDQARMDTSAAQAKETRDHGEWPGTRISGNSTLGAPRGSAPSDNRDTTISEDSRGPRYSRGMDSDDAGATLQAHCPQAQAAPPDMSAQGHDDVDYYLRKVAAERSAQSRLPDGDRYQMQSPPGEASDPPFYMMPATRASSSYGFDEYGEEPRAQDGQDYEMSSEIGQGRRLGDATDRGM